LFHESKTSADLVRNISEILSEVAQFESKGILLVDPIQSLVGPSGAFDGAASAMLRDAIKNGDVQCFGASTDIAFRENVASDESLASLFASVEMQEVMQPMLSKAMTIQSAEKSSKRNTEDFVGEKISDDLRQLIDSGKAPARVKAILQVDNTNSEALRSQLAKYGVNIDAQMAQFGALAVDVPTRAIKELANSSQTRHLSLDRAVQVFWPRADHDRRFRHVGSDWKLRSRW